MQDLIRGILFGLAIGISGVQAFSPRQYTKTDLNRYQFLACSDGAIETLQYIIKERKTPADCKYPKDIK